MKTLIPAAFAPAFTAPVLPLSPAEAAIVRQVADFTAITQAPVDAVMAKRTVKTDAAHTNDTDTAD